MGALALSATAVSGARTWSLNIKQLNITSLPQVERAFKMFYSGVKVQDNVGQFSREKTEGLVADYLVNTSKLSKRRWRRVLDACGVDENETASVVASAPSMNEGRRNLYNASSPIPTDADSE